MNWELWTIWGTTAILAGSAFAIAFLSPIIKDWLVSPNLDFEFEHGPPCCHLTEMLRFQLMDGKPCNRTRFPVYYFRFVVVNNGRSPAYDYDVVLENVWERDAAGNFDKWKNFSLCNLKWAGGPPKAVPKTIHHNRRVFCDIGRIHHPDNKDESAYIGFSKEERRANKLLFEIPESPFSQPDSLVPGKHRIEVSVYGSNIRNKITKTFNISWSGTWQDTEEKMFREIVISSFTEAKEVNHEETSSGRG